MRGREQKRLKEKERQREERLMATELLVWAAKVDQIKKREGQREKGQISVDLDKQPLLVVHVDKVRPQPLNSFSLKDFLQIKRYEFLPVRLPEAWPTAHKSSPNEAPTITMTFTRCLKQFTLLQIIFKSV